ncbi:DUF5989 family protein [Sorangium sp. So ce1078]|uniref:DUF5989 family protein n=1 Tax=unclassified Sorangium TaxID=2621164 RepID=UPI003F5ED88B
MGKIRYATRLAGDIVAFAKHRKAYWIVPLVAVLALAAFVVVASQTAAPFVYTLF